MKGENVDPEPANVANPLKALAGLGKGIFILLFGVLVVMILVIVNLFNVAANQKATIENEKEIAAAVEQRSVTGRALVTKSLETINKVSADLDKLSVLYLTQEKELESHRGSLAEIVAAEHQLVAEQGEVLKAARQASVSANNAASQTRHTSQTIQEKVATTAEKKSVTKQEAKNDAKSKQLNTLVGQYKSAIRKADHP